ncbi:MAG: tyrosine-type recombinase/integrase [Oscillospiraceae bacterium]|nr:tyrosine-type recombinase/integrase [Oscillospiraceae bacterium]
MYEDIFSQIRNEAEKRNLRDSTINAYCNSVNYFLRSVNKDVSALTTDDVDAFLTEKRLNGLAPQTYNHYHSSIRFFYKRVLKINWDEEDIPRMKLDRSLPTVLSRDEMQSIIDHTPNLKHKAIIATMYSSGLRVSEVVHLHYDDISRTNKTIHVRESKSRRDRYTILSDRNLDLLTEYWFQCGKPRNILFPSSWTGTYLDRSTINQYFKKSAARAGITKHVSSHCCRHSFASHLFENGVDIKYIQALLGHIDPRSTEVYIHVSNKSLLGIRSPFDGPRGGES